jgi:hypothetical protein
MNFFPFDVSAIAEHLLSLASSVTLSITNALTAVQGRLTLLSVRLARSEYLRCRLRQPSGACNSGRYGVDEIGSGV